MSYRVTETTGLPFVLKTSNLRQAEQHAVQWCKGRTKLSKFFHDCRKPSGSGDSLYKKHSGKLWMKCTFCFHTSDYAQTGPENIKTGKWISKAVFNLSTLQARPWTGFWRKGFSWLLYSADLKCEETWANIQKGSFKTAIVIWLSGWRSLYILIGLYLKNLVHTLIAGIDALSECGIYNDVQVL